MEKLVAAGIPAHFEMLLSDNERLVKPLNMMLFVGLRYPGKLDQDHFRQDIEKCRLILRAGRAEIGPFFRLKASLYY